MSNSLFEDQPKKEPKTKEKKFVRIKVNSTKEEFSTILQRVQKGELKWSFYGTDGETGYQHYEVLKNN